MATKTVSILTGGSNNHTTSAEEVNAMYTDILSDGVVGTITNTSGVAPATGNFAVNAQGTPNMTVRVSQGVAYVTGTPSGGNSQRFRVSMWSYEDVTIAANSTGSTRYDHIYISLDAAKLANPGVSGDDVATLVTSRSTSASTDNGTPPTYGYKLAVVTVANSASSISNANITDSRVQTGATAISGNNIVAANNLSTSAITLGYAQITSNFTTTTAGSYTDITGLTVSVTVPAGGRRIKITGFARNFKSSQAAGNATWVRITEDGTQIAEAVYTTPVTNYSEILFVVASKVATAGSHTYVIQGKQDAAGTYSVDAGSTYPAFILVEAI